MNFKLNKVYPCHYWRKKIEIYGKFVDVILGIFIMLKTWKVLYISPLKSKRRIYNIQVKRPPRKLCSVKSWLHFEKGNTNFNISTTLMYQSSRYCNRRKILCFSKLGEVWHWVLSDNKSRITILWRSLYPEDIRLCFWIFCFF